MTKAIISIGIPGCGKTTYLKPLAAELGYTYVNIDDIRLELTGDAADHGSHAASIRIFHERVAAALRSGGVVVDVTNSRRRDRVSLATFCRLHGADEVVGLWFDVPFSVCQERNRARARVVPEPAMERIRRRLELNPPALDEGFDRIDRLTA